MKTNFICPKCSGHLQVGGYVIFAVTTKKGKRGLILLSPHLGDYTKFINSDFQVDEGEEVDFFCPLCHANLAANEVHPRLVRLLMIDENAEKHEIFFSGIEGEKCTYKISEKKYEKYGSASDTYDSYFRTRRV
jgi:protein-disulfide isomerase